jgi:TMEM175 potassium channel family protein
MFVALFPFSTSLIADYGDYTIAAVFFNCNMFLTGLMAYRNWSYATKYHRFVEPDLDDEKIKMGKIRSLVTPAISLLAIAISFFNPRLSTIPYIFIPVLIGYLNR